VGAPVGSGSARRLRDVVTSDARRAAYLAAGQWDGTTLVDRVREHAASRPGDVAVVDGDRRRTYADLEGDARRIAGFLLDSGVGPGDVVAVQLPNRWETVAVALGVLAVGAVINPMLPVYRARELRHMLGTGRARAMFLPDSYRGFDHVAMVGGLAAELPLLTTRVVVPLEGGPTVPPGWTSLAAVLERDAVPLPAGAGAAAEDVSELIFTSGTEAAPKAVMHTEQTTNFSVRTAFRSLGMDASDVVWMPSPVGHSTGFNYGVRMALYHGLRLVLQDRWDGAEAARLIEAERCSYTLAATTFLRDLVRAARDRPRDLSSMRLFGSGGAPVPPDLVREAAAHDVTVLRLYGSTEVLVGTWNRPGSTEAQRVGTDGVAVDGVEVQAWDDAGAPVVGEPGEIHTRGPNTCAGFLDDPERTAATFHPDGWVRSGDLAMVDDDGHLTVVGRKKEIIIRGGLNVAPREVEDLVVLLPGVLAAAVVGIPDERLGETGCACVVLQPGAELDLAAAVAHLRGHGLAAYKLPERLEIVDELPTTSTGKVQKHVLIERITSRG
jgi:acyl-CoA synthetase (AMP-forming)/AMP-acid ligase II